MTRSLTQRIGKLEALYAAPKQIRSPLVMLAERVPERAHAPGERVVEDWFRDRGSMVWARERVTTETEDSGRRCPPGGYLLDVLEDFHTTTVPGARAPECARCARKRR